MRKLALVLTASVLAAAILGACVLTRGISTPTPAKPSCPQGETCKGVVSGGEASYYTVGEALARWQTAHPRAVVTNVSCSPTGWRDNATCVITYYEQ